ncbi:hypothetical protein [Streptomyces blastmyceticus]|uniref:hypothetical protein n=1 Tax=Streptomyces blastmyceticus TaxID=68180 RepID=UPI0031DEEFCD
MRVSWEERHERDEQRTVRVWNGGMGVRVVVDMTPELVTAVAALLGVVLGLVGAVVTARIQVRGAVAQAVAAEEGARAQAEAGFRAAVHTAREQRAVTLDQQAREARRAVYARFLAAAHACRDGLDRLMDGSAVRESLRDEVAELRRERVLVELEGPEEVERHLADVCRLVEHQLYSVYERRDLLYALFVCENFELPGGQQLTEAQVGVVGDVDDALREIGSVREGISPLWCDVLVRTFTDPEPERAERRARMMERSRDPVPDERALQRFDDVLERVWPAFGAVVESGAMTSRQMSEIRRYVARTGRGWDLPRYMEGRRDELEVAIAGFRSTARRTLHDAAPAGSPSPDL